MSEPGVQLTCPACGAIAAAGKFCSECGAPLPPPARFCRQCGAQLSAAVKFCSECGAQASVAAGAPPPADAASAPAPGTATPPADTRTSAAAPGPTGAAPDSPPREFRRRLAAVAAKAGPGEPTFFVHKNQIPALAAALRTVRDNRLVPEPVFKALHQAITLGGPGEELWTVGLGSLAWNRLQDGAWRPAEAPPWVRISSARLAQALAAGRQGQPVIDVALAAMPPGGRA